MIIESNDETLPFGILWWIVKRQIYQIMALSWFPPIRTEERS